MKYNRQLLMAILYDRVKIARMVNTKLIPLSEAPQAYADFDKVHNNKTRVCCMCCCVCTCVCECVYVCVSSLRAMLFWDSIQGAASKFILDPHGLCKKAQLWL